MLRGSITDDDGLAMARYLKTLPGVHNQVHLPLQYGFVKTLLRKLAYAWTALIPERLSYYAGNFGSEMPAAFPRDLPQRLLIWAQLGLLVLGAIAYPFAPRRVRAFDSPLRGLSMIVTVLLLVLSGAGLVIYK